MQKLNEKNELVAPDVIEDDIRTQMPHILEILLLDRTTSSPKASKNIIWANDNYKKYDGFVICHGTDTMAYTASALSFMLENLNKPVILTGSQIPLCLIRSDGRDNLVSSLLIATEGKVSEVCICFGR